MSNQRIHRPMKEHKIPQISFPKLPTLVILSGVNDRMLPEQIPEDLKARDDIIELSVSKDTKTSIGVNHLVFLKIQSEISSWKFCNSTTSLR